MNLQVNIKGWSENTSHHTGQRNSKVMLMLFWDFKEHITEHYQGSGQIVNSTVQYSRGA
jgi:hypothetical protein